MPRPPVSPLDPDSDAGKALAARLTAFLASVEPEILARRRARQVVSVTSEQKAA
jgi:hypothetical protein